MDDKIEKYIKIVREIINNWDPFNLLRSGSPADEYYEEIQKISYGLQNCKKIKDIHELIYNVFKESFGDKSAGDKNLYLNIAREIFKRKKSGRLE